MWAHLRLSHAAHVFQLHEQEHQPQTFVECCAMQLATMLEPALLSPSPAPARLLSSIMARLVRYISRLFPNSLPSHLMAHNTRHYLMCLQVVATY